MLVRLFPWLFPVVAGIGGLLAIDVPLAAIVKYSRLFRLLCRPTRRTAAAVRVAKHRKLGRGRRPRCSGRDGLPIAGLGDLHGSGTAILVAGLAAARPGRLRGGASAAAVLADRGAGSAAGGLVLGPGDLRDRARRHHHVHHASDHKPPPNGTSYYQDLLFHLSMVHELMRSMPPQWPQVAGEPLEYHWFANADMAGAVDITRRLAGPGVVPTLAAAAGGCRAARVRLPGPAGQQGVVDRSAGRTGCPADNNLRVCSARPRPSASSPGPRRRSSSSTPCSVAAAAVVSGCSPPRWRSSAVDRSRPPCRS